jgi:TonB family protein
MKSPRLRRSPFTRAALAALALALLACPLSAQESKPAPTTPPPEPGGGPGPRPPDLRPPEGPFTTREITKRAVITSNPSPRVLMTIPEDNPSHGVVRLRVILSSTGVVKDITVIKGLPGGLTERAVEAAGLIEFTPAQKDGRRVSQYVTLEYNFGPRYEEADVTKRVSILERPRADYTLEAREHRVAGRVVVEATFGADGKVYEARVVEGLPDGLSSKAVEAALRIKFRPAERGGRKVSVLRRVEYVFPPDE